MFLLVFFFGTIWGFLVACIVIGVALRFQTNITRNINTIVNHPIITNGKQSYIAGLSDEESSFAESLPIDKEIKIL